MSDDRPTSPFSQSLAAVLRGYMSERGITRDALMEHMHRSKGYVAEHLNGTRPPDTDLIFAVAELDHVSAWDLVEVIRRRIGDQPPEDRAATANRIAKKAVAGKKAAPAKPRATRRRKRA
jgi:transcriptional regulator with XRE-family HTH domain